MSNDTNYKSDWWQWEAEEDGTIPLAHKRVGRTWKARCGVRLHKLTAFNLKMKAHCPVCEACANV